MTREEMEAALDAGKLRCRMNNGNLWQVRRNGKTRTWKTRPGDFKTPVKIGFKIYGTISPQVLLENDLVIAE